MVTKKKTPAKKKAAPKKAPAKAPAKVSNRQRFLDMIAKKKGEKK